MISHLPSGKWWAFPLNRLENLYALLPPPEVNQADGHGEQGSRRCRKAHGEPGACADLAHEPGHWDANQERGGNAVGKADERLAVSIEIGVHAEHEAHQDAVHGIGADILGSRRYHRPVLGEDADQRLRHQLACQANQDAADQ